MRISEMGSVGSYESLGTQNNQLSSVDNELGVQTSEEIVVQDVDSNEQSSTENLKVSEEMLDKAVEQANKSLKNFNRYIQRTVHEKTHSVMYVMKDSTTDEVIREFPPKKIQDMIAKMWELAGLFVDEKA